jgi:hypothetical protein
MITFKEFLAEAPRFEPDSLHVAGEQIGQQMGLGQVMVNYGPNLAVPNGKVEYTVRFYGIKRRIERDDLLFELDMMKRAIVAAFKPRGVTFKEEHPGVYTGEDWRSWEDVLKRKGLGRGTHILWSIWVDKPK